MANTIAAAILPEILGELAVTSMGTISASMNNFTTKVELNPIAPASIINVPLITAASSALTNPASFEAGDSTATNIEITPAKIVCPIHATDAEMQRGTRAEWFLGKAMQTMQNKLVDLVFAPVTEANFGSAILDKTIANFTTADLPTIWAAAKNYGRRNLYLEGSHYAKCLPTTRESFDLAQNGAYGFDSFNLHNRWTGAGTDIIGFVADSTAIAIACGESYYDDDVLADLLMKESVMLPNGLTITLTKWVSRASRQVWYALETMFGAALGDSTAGEVIEGATD